MYEHILFTICLSSSWIIMQLGGAGGSLAGGAPIFGRSIKPIPTRGAYYVHYITTSPQDFWTVRRLCMNVSFWFFDEDI